MSNWECSGCKKIMSDYFEVGYDGPKDRSDTSCHPAVEWEVLCIECETRTADHTGSRPGPA